MILAISSMVEWLAGLTGSTPQAVELGLRVSLLACLLIALIQFVIMMVTRWGDSDPSRKAFMFSVLVHLSLTFGVVAVSTPQKVAEAVEESQPKLTREIKIESEEPVEIANSGNTRVWEKLPETPAQELSRSERTPLEFTPMEAPQRQTDDVTPPDVDVPEIQHEMEMPVARPEIQNFGDSGPKVQSVAPLRVDDPTAEARPDINIPTMSLHRRRVVNSGIKDIQIERSPTRGAVDQVTPDFPVERQMASIDATPDATSFLQRSTASDSVSRRSAPVPADLPAPGTGASTTSADQPSASGAIGPPKFSRLRTRTPRMEEFGGVQRFQPERTPQTPNPSPEPAVGVRDGLVSANPIDGLKPNAERPRFDPINPGATTKIPPTYRLRSLAKRAETARRYGGTDASERAVEASLQWLALHQNPEGFWDADGFMSLCPDGDRCTGRSGLVKIDDEGQDRQNAGLTADSGVTGLAILAFLGAGYTHEEGRYADQVDRALSWLIRKQRADGFLAPDGGHYDAMYCHGMATYALAEALGMQTDRTNDRRLREPLERAVRYILDHQNPTDGGWRYQKGQRSDMSMFGWQLMALKSAEIAGVTLPKPNKDLMIRFLNERSLGDRGGLSSYRKLDPEFKPLPPSASMTAEAMFCKQMLGMQRTNPQSIEAVEYLMARRPSRQSEDIYYWYYGTLAMYQFGGEDWRNWNASLRDYLVADQRTTDHAAGSWDPKAPWGPYGGRVFSTALSTLCLEVYYRFLPLYQTTEDPGAN